MTDELLTSAEVRAVLGVGQNALTRYLPTIRHFRLGNPRTGPVRIRRSDLEAWMERRMVAPVEEEHDQEVRDRKRAAQPWCTYCRSSLDLEVHHVLAVADGGTHDDANLVVACASCHASLHALPGRTYRRSDPSRRQIPPHAADVVQRTRRQNPALADLAPRGVGFPTSARSQRRTRTGVGTPTTARALEAIERSGRPGPAIVIGPDGGIVRGRSGR